MKSLRLITFLLSILFISCEENKTVIQDVPFDFESNNLSPNLVAGEDYLGLSWLHVEDGKPNLYYNQFRNNAWQTPRKIAEGGDCRTRSQLFQDDSLLHPTGLPR